MLFDDLYKEIGEFGPYQIIFYILLQIISIPVGWSHVSVTFLGAWMDHWCYVDELRNLTSEQQKDISIPIENTRSGYSHCYMYDLSYANFTEGDLKTWNRSVHIDDKTPVKRCSSWYYDKSVFGSTMMSEWDLVCDRSHLVALSQTFYMLGLLLGSFFFGQLSDAIGRRKTMIICIILWIISGISASFCPSFYGFTALRFLVGATAMGAYAVSFVLCMEVIGPSWRMETGILVQGFFALGIMALAGVAYKIREFNQISLIISVIPVWCLLHFIFIPESPRWLVSKGYDSEAEKIIRKIAKFNGREAPEVLNLKDNRIGIDDVEKATVLDLFKTRRLRIFTICMWLCWAIVTIEYYGLSFGVDMLPGSLFFNTFLVGLVEIPAYLLAIVALRTVGRKSPLIATYVGCAVFCLIAIPMLKKENLQTVLLSFLMIGKGCGSATFAILYVYSAELFPTVARNVGVGTSSMAGRVGGLIQPQMALMGKWWFPAPFLMYGVVGVIGCVVALVFPETRNRKLPETLEEAEGFGLKKKDLEDAEKDLEITFLPKGEIELLESDCHNGKPDTELI